jgi:hypothetical protein
MRRSRGSLQSRAFGGRTWQQVGLLAVLVATGCNSPQSLWPWWPNSKPPQEPTATPSTDAPAAEAPTAPASAPPPRFVATSNPPASAAPPTESARAAGAIRLDVALAFLHVQVPSTQREQTRTLWNHLREDVLDADTVLRLERNGIRVGTGSEQWWDAVQAALDAVEGVRTIATDPVHVPPSYPLALELDTAPRDQTLFYAGADGVLTGESWPQSRNVLRVSYELNLEDPERLRLTLVPEVRQKLEGWKWVRSEAGVAKLPNYGGRAFGAAGFRVDLRPGQFLLVAPGPRAGAFGLIGTTFLVQGEEGRPFDSYVFLRADVSHVAERN